jgi:hypothetical protein
MKAFTLKGTLKSPAVIGKRSPNLAGILYHCCFLHTATEEGAAQLLSELLKMTDGVYHASDLLFGVDTHQNLIASTYSTVGTMNSSHDLTADHIKPNGKNGKYARVQLEGGPTKSRLDTHKAHFAKSVVFHGYGDHVNILRLIKYYIPAVGLFSAGTVDDWSCCEQETDQSFYIQNNYETKILINRLPAASSLLVHETDAYEMASLSPPFYKAANQTLCAMPSRINKTLDI